jgi:hypothetical protein
MKRRTNPPFALVFAVVVLAVGLVLAASPAIAQAPAQSFAQQDHPDDVATFPGVDLPLKGERLLSETFTEGSWISLDVQPDGEQIVFDLLGDLYVLPMTGGRARPLTRDMALNRQPRFSPDGERIVFVSDRSGGENLWTISTDGRDIRQITRGFHSHAASFRFPDL